MATSLKPTKSEVWKVNLGPSKVLDQEKNSLVIVASLAPLEKRYLCIPLGLYQPSHDNDYYQVLVEPDKRNGLSNMMSAATHIISPIHEDRFMVKVGAVQLEFVDGLLASVNIITGFSV